MLRICIRKFSGASRLFSAQIFKTRKTVRTLKELYEQKTPISVVTAWDAITGNIANQAEVDIVLVGDSLAMVALGHKDTIALELDDMVHHVKAVSRGNMTSFLVADLPFGSFEESEAQAVQSSIKLMKKGMAQAVKIEGGVEIAPTIKRIVKAGVPVMGHVGLSPQKHNLVGGFSLQGSTYDSAVQIIEDCIALEKAGVFAIVIECVPNKLAQILTDSVSIPTIGIGAGNAVSGQVLVTSDILGMEDRKPAKFVKRYMDFYGSAMRALESYNKDVKSGSYPDSNEHGYKINSQVLAKIREYLAK
ncbi:ketopantoate hydroxymethyltransferase [Metschnikowia bicuspidata]|uniref:3-methyl-2-oxobutanoate hydroxymethyltransferase n=1 Tax=Metschnikowia bicuspidata TaxID=27322 RepID=A0A4P9Z950_9ASCO|nr:ketopantoate hydroxymethyltransferase [Metschnikowia bicuspidata]RKP29121.1 ketopantoate hydroxymethyltransferase [Metschnikowia bicuspidata]